MPKVAEEVWSIDELNIPVDIYHEWRKSHRISIARNRVILRTAFWSADMKAIKAWATQWIRHQLAQNPALTTRFKPKDYFTGHSIRTPRADYLLHIVEKRRKTNTARLDGHHIRLILNEDNDQRTRSRTIQSLIARIMAKDQLIPVTKRLRELNERWIGGTLRQIRIKNNASNWGSCSSTGNINISARTLLTPFEIQDYIFVHELAHLKELNHSERFWSLVARIDPEYASKEKWLKTTGKSVVF